MPCHPFLVRSILRYKCSMPLGITKTTKGHLFARKYTFSYSYTSEFCNGIHSTMNFVRNHKDKE